MEDAIRLIIILLFIGLIVVAIVFFGIFFLAPLGNVGGLLGGKSTSTETVTLPPLNQQTPNGNQGQGTTPPVETPSQPAETAPATSTGNQTPSEQTPSSGGSSAGASITGPSLSSGDYRLISQSGQIGQDQIPSNAVKLTVSSTGFSPVVITGQAGGIITLAIISSDDNTHVFKFDNPSLSSISVGVGPSSARLLTFVIMKPGIYGFHDDVPGRAQAGVVGKLILN
ncbi:cupredoxin domain-containing protein [Patescibacteria group bacterium]|nr:cupredoxin domain-containing protein [Patescibacteria group bacterium]MCL5114611.1 cupredoxin domain-containing protein [Patescibacteria group bacterium]